MMRHIVISVSILALALAFCIFSACYIRSTMLEPLNLLEQAQTQADEQQLQAATKTVRAAKADWESHSGYYGVVLLHSETHDVLRNFAALQQFGEEGDQEEFCATCAELIAMLRHLREMELPAYFNLL